jgi:hypothetical protein
MKSKLSPYGGTKFVLAFVSHLSTFALCLQGRIDGSVYLAATAAVVGAYLTSDVIQRKNEAEPR